MSIHALVQDSRAAVWILLFIAGEKSAQDHGAYFPTTSIPHLLLKSNDLPQYLAALPQKDGCKNRLYEQKRLSSFRKNEKNLLAAGKWQTALSAKNTGKADFLNPTICAQKAARLYGEEGIIIGPSPN